MINLRGKQPQAIEELRAGFRAGKKRQVLYFPTGGGKTEIAIWMMHAAALKGNKSAMCMNRRVLVEQTSKRLDKYSINHGVTMAGHQKTDSFIQICSEQTLSSRGGLNDIDLLILDECHDKRADTLAILEANPKIKAIGLSASPFTDGLSDIYDGVVSVTTTKELVELGLLAPLKTFVAKEIDMAGARKNYGEWSEGEAEKRAILISLDIVEEWEKKTFEFFGEPRKTIVFASGVKHAQELAEKFQAAGYNFMPVSYKDSEETKTAIIEEFNKPDSSIIGLIATDILTKGFDVSDVVIGVSARPFNKSFSSHVQQLGRIMRSHNGKEFGLWICHSGNYLRFYDDWLDLYHNGVSELVSKDKPKKEPSEQDKKEHICPECNAIMTTAGKCDICGWEKEKPPADMVDGEIVEVVMNEDDAPKLIAKGVKQYRVKTFEIMPHRSKSGNNGFKAIINGKYTTYFATHTSRGFTQYTKAKTATPTHFIADTNGRYPEITLIWQNSEN